jgi:hypothetical protein
MDANPAVLAVEYGAEIMHIHADGGISRPALRREAPNYVGPSGQWKLRGAVERNNFGAVTRRYTVAQVLSDWRTIPWHFKNGAQRTFLQDYDHGTMREWRSPKHRPVYAL